MRHPSALAATTLALAGLVCAGCGSSGGSSGGKTEASGYPATSTSTASGAAASGAAGSSAATTVTTEHTSLGTILAAGPKRLTVYLFAADTGSTSTCSEACAQAWPPVTTTGAPRAEGATVAADLGTTTRSDGTKQVTYKGHPLYYYVSDSQAGETTGQGINSFGAPWWVLSPAGSAVH